MSDSPRPTFNVATAERERTAVEQPFVAVFERPANWQELKASGKPAPKNWHDGEVEQRAVTMTDPSDIDWKDLLSIQQPVEFLKFCVTAEDREFIKTCPMEAWRFGALIEAYQRHYGLDNLGNGGASRI